MVSSKETTPEGYLASLPADRRSVVAAVRALIVTRLPKGYVETMNWGMIVYEVPLARFPDTYNKQPLLYLALAAQQNNYALYMTGVSGNTALMDRLAAAYKAAGRKFDMGKSCLRFTSLDALPLDVIGDIVASTSVDERIAGEKARVGARASMAKKSIKKKSIEKKSIAKKAVARKLPAPKAPATTSAVKRLATKKAAAKKAGVRKSSERSR